MIVSDVLDNDERRSEYCKPILSADSILYGWQQDSRRNGRIYRGGGSPDDYMADELNRRQVPGGWYGGGAPYQYPYAPYSLYAPYAAPRTYYPWGY
jgi:hypothetical protein